MGSGVAIVVDRIIRIISVIVTVKNLPETVIRRPSRVRVVNNRYGGELARISVGRVIDRPRHIRSVHGPDRSERSGLAARRGRA